MGDFILAGREPRSAKYARRFFLGSVGLAGLDPLPEILLIAAPTAWLWYTNRRAEPWQRPRCRYDLRGLEGGVCPECGSDTAAETG